MASCRAHPPLLHQEPAQCELGADFRIRTNSTRYLMVFAGLQPSEEGGHLHLKTGKLRHGKAG